MKLLNYNAAAQLLERMKTLEHQPHGSWRAIHICLFDKHEYTGNLRRHFFIHPLCDMLADHDGTIYVLDDGDIIILFQGRCEPVIRMLNARFADIDDTEGEGLFTVYDLSRYWQLFYDLCAWHARMAVHARLEKTRPAPQVMFRTTREIPTS